MDLMQHILVFAFVLGGMIIVHELGHFIVAKLFGVRVEVFSVGFGKRLWGIRRGDTDYRISLFPLGGYVKMAGESFSEQATGAPDEFLSKPKWQRLLIALAGPAANILTALLIPAAVVMISYEVPAYLSKPAIIGSVAQGSPAQMAGLKPGDLITRVGNKRIATWRDLNDIILISPDQELELEVRRSDQTLQFKLRVGTSAVEREKIGYAGIEPDYGPNAKLVIGSVAPGSPAHMAGIKAGDQLLAINDAPVEQSPTGWDKLVRAVRTSDGKPLKLTLSRDGQKMSLSVTPQLLDGTWKLGIGYSLAGIEEIKTRLGPIHAFKYSLENNLRIVRLTGAALAQIFMGKRSVRDTFTGPVGIFQLTGQAAERGVMSVLELIAILSLNLGVFNLLPIPVLDGGLIFMLAIEALLGAFGFSLSARARERMVQIGFAVLVLLMALIIFNDISKYFPSRGAAIEQPKPAK
jgi:regulator of sigma E protease